MAGGYSIPAFTKINAAADNALRDNVEADGGTRSGYIREAIEEQNKRVSRRRKREAKKAASE